MHRTVAPLAAFFIALIAWPGAAFADDPQIPHCASSYGTLALKEPEDSRQWWRDYDLENPEALLKYYVSESGCFTMVDRGDGLQMRGTERDLADSGELQVDSNMGAGQLVAADFFLVPDLMAQDSDTGGKGLGGAIGGRLGGKVGGLIGGLKTKKLEAETILTLVNARTGVQQYSVRGKASKTDVSFGAGGLLGAVAGLGGGYGDTEIGRVISTAYAQAYTELVAKVQSAGGGADTSAPTQAYRLAIDSDLYAQPARGESVRKLRSGMQVYPTGARDGAFLEVKDKFGTQGWVSVEDLQ